MLRFISVRPISAHFQEQFFQQFPGFIVRLPLLPCGFPEIHMRCNDLGVAMQGQALFQDNQLAIIHPPSNTGRTFQPFTPVNQ